MKKLFFESGKHSTITAGLVSASIAVMLAFPCVSFGAETEGTSVDVSISYSSESISAQYTSEVPYITDVMFYLVGENEEFVSLQESIRFGSGEFVPGEGADCTILSGDDISDGRYRIYAIPGGYASEDYVTYSDSFRYMNSTNRNLALDKVNDAPDNGIAQVVFDEFSDVFDFEEAEAPLWKNSYLATMKRDDCGGKFTNVDMIADSWDLSDVLKKINSVSGNELKMFIEENSALLGVDASQKYYNLYNAEALRIINSISESTPLLSKKAFGNAFYESCAVAAVNKSDSSDLESAFTENSEILGIDSYIDRYEDISKASFARQFDGFSADSAEEVKEKFVSVLTGLENSGSSSGGSSGGSGGSSGGGGGKSSSSGGNISIAPSVVSTYTPEKKTFADTERHWAADYISALGEMKIINGYADGTFKPEALISREEFAKIVVTAFDLSYDGELTAEFGDIPYQHWAYASVSTAAGLGVVNGVGNGRFGAGENISRQDAAVMLYRAVSLSDSLSFDKGESISFSDVDRVSGYALEAVDKLSRAGIINGFSDGSYAPEKFLTRAEAAKIIFATLTAQ